MVFAVAKLQWSSKVLLAKQGGSEDAVSVCSFHFVALAQEICGFWSSTIALTQHCSNDAAMWQWRSKLASMRQWRSKEAMAEQSGNGGA